MQSDVLTTEARFHPFTTLVRHFGLFAGVLAIQISSYGTAFAQEGDSANGAAIPVCIVEAAPVEEADEFAAERDSLDAAIVFASCNGIGIYLGEADRFEVTANDATGAIVVEIERLGRTRIMLLASDNGEVFVEDLTGALAVAAGRLPTAGLRGVRADFAAFDTDGSIGLTSEDTARRGAGDGSARFSLQDHLAATRSYRAAARAVQSGGDL